MNYLVILFFSLTALYPIDIKLRYLEYRTGCRFRINSANRTIGHNLKVGGSKKSMHLVNKGAYDLRRSKQCQLSYSEIGLIAKEIYKGVIVYKNHIHVDMRSIEYYR